MINKYSSSSCFNVITIQKKLLLSKPIDQDIMRINRHFYIIYLSNKSILSHKRLYSNLEHQKKFFVTIISVFSNPSE